ncbi:MAG: GNAT family N-acetyltransferase [Oscillospiraceae bacterium]|nr:GNAT family N-acetyltransferase [Oscillospiraceae bacterium]
MREFVNRKTGERLRCTFVLACQSASNDAVADGLIECLREEYGETYVDKRVYDRAWIAQEVAAGRLLIAAALDESGTAAAYICLRENPPFYGVGDLCMHVVRKRFRGFGIAAPLVSWIIEQPEADCFSAIGSHNATFHTISQRTSYICGLRPCGMEFGLYKSEGFIHSHENIGAKMSYAIAAMPRGRQTVSLCPVEGYGDFLEEYYKSVDTPIQWITPAPCAAKSEVDAMQDTAHSALLLYTQRCGADLGELVTSQIKRYESDPLQTLTACVELADPCAQWGCDVLERLGFFFCGVQPFCRGKNYLLFHHPMQVNIPFDALCIDGQYERMYRRVCGAAERKAGAK